MNSTTSESQTVDARPAVGSRRKILLLLMALCFISHLNRISMAMAGDSRIMKQYGLSPEQMGWIYSSFLLVYTICMVPGGLFIDRFGARTALIVVGVGSAFFGFLTGAVGWLVPSGFVLVALMLVRGTMGFFTTPLHPGCARAVGLWMPISAQSLTNGWVTGAALLGIASTYWIFGRLIDAFDWPGAFATTAAVTLLIALAWAVVSRQAQVNPRAAALESERAARVDWSVLLRNRRLFLLTLSYAAVSYFQYLFFYWMHYYFSDVLKLGKATSEFYAAIPPLAMAIGMPTGGWLSDLLDRRTKTGLGRGWVPLVGMIAGGLLVLGGVMTRDPVWSVTWFSLALGVVGTCEGTFWSTAIDLGRGQGGTAAAIVNTGGNAGGFLAPILTPWISRTIHWQAGIGLGGVICLLGALCWLGIGSTNQDETSGKERSP